MKNLSRGQKKIFFWSIDEKKFFLLKMNLEDEKMNFPPFSKKKKFLSWHMKNLSRGEY